MALLETCRRVRGEIARRDELLREAKKAGTYSERASEIALLRAGLTATIGRIKVLLDHGVPVGALRNPTGALERLRSYQGKLAASPGESGSEHGHTKRALDVMQGALDTAASAALKAFIDKIPSLEETFLKQVEANPLYAKQVAEIRAARNELSIESRRDLNATELQSFLKKQDALRERTNQLNPTDFPKEVLEFFKATRGAGAPLEMLTSSVRQWFENRGQLKNIRVTVVDQ